MDDLFQEQQEFFTAIYIDDLTVFSTNWNSYIEHLKQVLYILD